MRTSNPELSGSIPSAKRENRVCMFAEKSWWGAGSACMGVDMKEGAKKTDSPCSVCPAIVIDHLHAQDKL